MHGITQSGLCNGDAEKEQEKRKQQPETLSSVCDHKRHTIKKTHYESINWLTFMANVEISIEDFWVHIKGVIYRVSWKNKQILPQ